MARCLRLSGNGRAGGRRRAGATPAHFGRQWENLQRKPRLAAAPTVAPDAATAAAPAATPDAAPDATPDATSDAAQSPASPICLRPPTDTVSPVILKRRSCCTAWAARLAEWPSGNRHFAHFRYLATAESHSHICVQGPQSLAAAVSSGGRPDAGNAWAAEEAAAFFLRCQGYSSFTRLGLSRSSRFRIEFSLKILVRE